MALFSNGCADKTAGKIAKQAAAVPYFTISHSYLPKAVLRPGANTILLVNQLDVDKLELSRRDARVVKAGAYTALKNGGVQLATLGHVRIVNLTDSTKFKVNPNSISALASKYHADYTLVLTGYNASITIDPATDGADYYTNEIIVRFTLYVGDGRLYKELEGQSDSWSIPTDLGTVGSMLFTPTVGGHKAKIVEDTKYAVSDALREYLPYTETKIRPLYVNNQLQPMVNEILGRRFDKACALSQPFLTDKDTVLACQAAYNLAVVYEAQGDFQKAANMIQFSMGKYKNEYARNVIDYLNTKLTSP